MANRRKLTIDKTYLSLDQAEARGFIHRDYIAHCLRWTHFIKCISQGGAYKTARVLDIGCGREIPLAKTLYSSRLIPAEYVGVDVGPIPDEEIEQVGGKFPGKFYEHTDFGSESISDEMQPFDFITCFEVLEHVEPQHALRILKHIRDSLTDDGRAFLSTPCWNGVDCAANHVNEMRYDTFGAMINAVGLQVYQSYGTFASQSDLLPVMDPQDRDLFDTLRSYYDSNFLSCIFAPKYAKFSRNALWYVGLPQRYAPPMMFSIEEAQEPPGSSDQWANWKTWWPELINQLAISTLSPRNSPAQDLTATTTALHKTEQLDRARAAYNNSLPR